MKQYIFILPSDLTGGSESNLLKLVRFLSEQGHVVTVIFLSCHKEIGFSMWEPLKDVTYYYSPTKRESTGCIWLLWTILTKRPLFGRRFNRSFTSHVHCNALISVLRKFRLINVDSLVLRESTNVFSWFSGFKLSLISSLYRFYDKSACLVCQTQKMKTELLENVPRVREMDVRVVTNPLDVKQLSLKKNEYCEVTSKLFLKLQSSKVLLSVGRLVKEKAYDVLLDAFSSMEGDYQLLIVGEGPERESIERRITALGIDNRVHLVGMLSNPYPLMTRCDLGVVASRLEGFPNVLLEKMFLSPRVVSTTCAHGIENIPGIYTCDTDNPAALANSMVSALMEQQDSTLENKALMLQYVYKLSVESFFNKIS